MLLIELNKAPSLLLGKEIKMQSELNSTETKGILRIGWAEKYRPSVFANWFYTKEKNSVLSSEQEVVLQLGGMYLTKLGS